jgi:ankyrin repeat protein
MLYFRQGLLTLLCLPLLFGYASGETPYTQAQNKLIDQASLSIEQKNGDALQKILEAGLNPNALTSDGQKLLHLAARHNDAASARLLLKFHAELDGLNRHEETPLMIAALEGHIDMIKLFHRYSADINPKTTWTPLCYAATGGDIPSVSYLIENGADLDRRCAKDISPLMMAIRQNHPKAALYLIDQGASISDESADGKTIWDWANLYQQTEIINKLKQFNTKP